MAVKAVKTSDMDQLMEAAYSGKKRQVAKILSRDPDYVYSTQGEKKITALHIAAQKGHFSIVRMLIKKKADVNKQDKFGYTALHYACEANDSKIAELLLKSGADGMIQNKHGHIPLYLLLQNEAPKAKKFLQLIRLFLEQKDFDVAVTGKNGETLIHAVIANSGLFSFKVLSMLLESGADPNILNPEGYTPLHSAILLEKVDLIPLLLQKQAQLFLNGENPSKEVIKAIKRNHEILSTIKSFMQDQPGGKRKLRKMIGSSSPTLQVRCLEDLPDSVQKLIDKNKLDQALMKEHFSILLRCLRFTTHERLADGCETKSQQDRRRAQRCKDEETLVKQKLKKEQLLNMYESGDAIFRKMEVVGKGGFGRVFAAQYNKRMSQRNSRSYSRDDVAGKKNGLYNYERKQQYIQKQTKVAIKKMPFATKKDKKNGLLEIYHMKQLRHKNIVSFIEAFEIKQKLEVWIVMEYLPGGTLGQAAKEYHITEVHICYIAREMLEGIKYLHARDIAHRDLKSANVMMSVTADVKLIDFGLCILLKDSNGEDVEITSMVGSAYWVPPEMILGQPHGKPTDIWSLAICLLDLANQGVPHRHYPLRCMFNVAVGEIPGLKSPEKYSRDFRDFMSLCLVRDPHNRATAKQLLKHPFMNICAEKNEMAEILQAIFLTKSLKSYDFI